MTHCSRSRLREYWCTAMAFAGLTVLCALPASAGDLDEVRGRGVLKMSCWPHQESLFVRRMIDEYGSEGLNRYTGLDVELMRGFAAELGVELEVVPGSESFASIFSDLQAGRGDVLASSITITPARQALFDFSVPYFIERMVVVAPSSSTIRTQKDLENLRGAVVQASSHDQRLRRLSLKGLKVVTVDYALEALESVQSGNADFALVDSVTIHKASAKYHEIESNLKVVIRFDDDEAYGVGVRKGSDLLAPLNAYLERLKRSGELKRMVDSYLPKDGDPLPAQAADF